MAIGLVQWFFFGAMLSPYSKSFEVVTLGSKSNRFAIPKLEASWVVVSFAARLLGFTKSIHTHPRATLGKNRVCVTKRDVARWVGPAIEHARDVPLVGEARNGV